MTAAPLIEAVLIGSAAAQYHFPRDVPWDVKTPRFSRDPMDRDIILTQAAYGRVLALATASGNLCEVRQSHGSKKRFLRMASEVQSFDCEVVGDGAVHVAAADDDAMGDASSKQLMRLANQAEQPWPVHEFADLPGIRMSVAPVDLLVAIKRSHLIFPVAWEKNVADYHTLKSMIAEKLRCDAGFAQLGPRLVTNPGVVISDPGDLTAHECSRKKFAAGQQKVVEPTATASVEDMQSAGFTWADSVTRTEATPPTIDPQTAGLSFDKDFSLSVWAVWSGQSKTVQGDDTLACIIGKGGRGNTRVGLWMTPAGELAAFAPGIPKGQRTTAGSGFSRTSTMRHGHWCHVAMTLSAVDGRLAVFVNGKSVLIHSKVEEKLALEKEFADWKISSGYAKQLVRIKNCEEKLAAAAKENLPTIPEKFQTKSKGAIGGVSSAQPLDAKFVHHSAPATDAKVLLLQSGASADLKKESTESTESDAGFAVREISVSGPMAIGKAESGTGFVGRLTGARVAEVAWPTESLGDGLGVACAVVDADYAKGPPARCDSCLDQTAIDDFMALRQQEGIARYGDSRVKLNIRNEDFFAVWYLKDMLAPDLLADALVDGKEIYKHDELHELVAYVNHKL